MRKMSLLLPFLVLYRPLGILACCWSCFQLIAKKVQFALQSGVKVMACIGELLEEREAGLTTEVVFKQMEAIRGMCALYVMRTVDCVATCVVSLPCSAVAQCDH